MDKKHIYIGIAAIAAIIGAVLFYRNYQTLKNVGSFGQYKEEFNKTVTQEVITDAQ